MNLLLIMISFAFLVGNYLAYKEKMPSLYNFVFVFLAEVVTILVLLQWEEKDELLLQVSGLVILFTCIVIIVPRILPRYHILIWSEIAFFVQMSTFMLYRIESTLARRHIIICLLGLAVIFPIYWVVKYFKTSYRFSFLYYALAIGLLSFNNVTRYGATNWTQIGNFMYQPSEFVKILFSLFLASFLLYEFRWKIFYSASVMSFVLIGILVIQRDLGGAFIFFTIYVVITYMYSHNKWLLFGQFVLAMGAAGASVYLFSHVRVRIISWLHPFEYAQNEGFQIIRSLQALINGKWLGTGLGNGSPERIPVVTSDFLFAAIGEEYGALFLMLLVLHFLFFMILLYNQCLKSKNKFYFYAGTSLTTMLAIQGFLIMAGCSGMIPLTGVVLPFVSYGGSAMIGNFMIVGLIENMSKINTDTKKEETDIHIQRESQVQAVKGLTKYIRALKVFVSSIYIAFLGYLIWLYAFWEMPQF